jgi:ubiquitin-conjugating enzyme E2 H
MYHHKPDEYVRKVQEYIKRYATEEALKDQDEDTSSTESTMSDFSEDETKDIEL